MTHHIIITQAGDRTCAVAAVSKADADWALDNDLRARRADKGAVIETSEVFWTICLMGEADQALLADLLAAATRGA